MTELRVRGSPGAAVYRARPRDVWRTRPGADLGNRPPVHSRCLRPLVTGDPLESIHQKRRVVDQVVQIIETARGIVPRPLVQLELHPSYSFRRDLSRRPERSACVHRRVFDHGSSPRSTHCRRSPGDRLSRPRSTTTAPPRAHPSADDAPIPTGVPGGHGRKERDMHGSHVHCVSINGRGARLCPCGLVTATP
jgi:hypothetical protein